MSIHKKHMKIYYAVLVVVSGLETRI